MVQNVAEGSPAAEAGFERGDVIVEVDKKPVKSVADLRESVDKHGKGKPDALPGPASGREPLPHRNRLAVQLHGPAGAHKAPAGFPLRSLTRALQRQSVSLTLS